MVEQKLSPQAPVLALPQRGAKPRKRGITAIIDFGPDSFGWTGSEAGIKNLLACAAEHIDYAKIYAMNALLMPHQVVADAVRCYRDAGVVPYAGGILFEYAWHRGEVEGLINLLNELGLASLEVSENCIVMSRDERMRQIEKLQKAGITVVYEFGRKHPEAPMRFEELDEVLADMSLLGIEHLTLEQSEIDMLVETSPTAMVDLRAQPWFDRLLIEVDPYRFPLQHAQAIRDFGPDVNLANITTGQVLRVEGFRRGVGRAVDYNMFVPGTPT
jgi:phosphosulfolactate synthase